MQRPSRPRTFSFYDWRLENVELQSSLKAVSSVRCQSCHGAGAVECGECGSDKECDRCDGTGNITVSVDDRLREIFNKQIRDDEKRWTSYVEFLIAQDAQR